jgi:Na+-translocating ferredoxin:NAD+ oxidoreductase subunit C
MTSFQIKRKLTGGLRLIARKRMSTAKHIARNFEPKHLVIPMTQHLGPPATPVVEIRQTLRRGEVVGRSSEERSTAVHTARAARVTGLEERLVPAGNRLIKSQCVLLEVIDDGDADNASINTAWPTDISARLQAIRDGGIVGLGGATFPTADKLLTQNRCSTLILNGAECEPFISCDDMLMREHSAEILRGAREMLDILGAQTCVIAIETDKPRAIETMTAALAALSDDRFQIAAVPTVYPAGGERQLIELLSGFEVPSAGYPNAIGYICQNVGTAYALERLMRTGEPLTTRVVSVTGTGIRSPQNVEVPIGSLIPELIAHCGGYAEDVTRLIVGGSMMGYAVESDDLPISKATNCVLATNAHEVRNRYDEWPCIRCGDCSTACPARLLPQELLRHSKTYNFPELDAFGLDDCIECGCCDVICPSGIPLTEYFRDAKHAQQTHHRHLDLADSSQIRYLNKQQRLQHQEVLTENLRSDLKAKLMPSSDSRRETIQAAIDRAQQRRKTDK